MSGNKLFYLFAIVAFFAACSPKVIKPVVVKKPVVKPVEVVKKAEVKKFTQGNIAVFIPFKLNQINLKTLTKAQASGADMPIDFYQGLMMGIDSAANTGLSFTDKISSVFAGFKKQAGAFFSQFSFANLFLELLASLHFH